jgi:hypothetical protein
MLAAMDAAEPSHLRGKPVDLFLRENSGGAIGSQCNLVCLVPNLQIPEILHVQPSGAIDASILSEKLPTSSRNCHVNQVYSHIGMSEC